VRSIGVVVKTTASSRAKRTTTSAEQRGGSRERLVPEMSKCACTWLSCIPDSKALRELSAVFFKIRVLELTSGKVVRFDSVVTAGTFWAGVLH